MNQHEADEIGQEVLLRVVAAIQDFDRRQRKGSFRRWLWNLTRWRVVDYRRQKESRAWEVLVGDMSQEWLANLPERVREAAADLEVEARLKLVWMGLRRLRGVAPVSMQIYDLYVLRGWDAGRVARFHHVSRASVYMIKNRVTPRLQRIVEQLMKQLRQGDAHLIAEYEAEGFHTPTWYRRLFRMDTRQILREPTPS